MPLTSEQKNQLALNAALIEQEMLVKQQTLATAPEATATKIMTPKPQPSTRSVKDIEELQTLTLHFTSTVKKNTTKDNTLTSNVLEPHSLKDVEQEIWGYLNHQWQQLQPHVQGVLPSLEKLGFKTTIDGNTLTLQIPMHAANQQINALLPRLGLGVTKHLFEQGYTTKPTNFDAFANKMNGEALRREQTLNKNLQRLTLAPGPIRRREEEEETRNGVSPERSSPFNIPDLKPPTAAAAA